MNIQVGDLYRYHDTDTGYSGLATISAFDGNKVSLHWLAMYYDDKPSGNFATSVHIVDFKEAFDYCWSKLA